MSELVDFLNQRLDEDEAVARAGLHTWDCTRLDNGEDDSWCDCDYGARVLAEVQAKRRIVAEHPLRWYTDEEPGFGMWMNDHPCKPPAPCRTLRLLALPYADHPDYRQEWTP